MIKKGLLKSLEIIFISFLVFSCGKNKNESLKIGAALPLTGNSASYGKSAQKGIELAVDENNGSHNSKVIKVIYEDTQAQPTTGVNVVQKLINQDNVKVIIGAMASSVTLAIAPIAEKDKIILMSPASSSPEITHAGDFIFRTAYSDTYEGRVLADYAFNKEGLKKFAILYINNAYGIGISKEFEKEFKKLGGSVEIKYTFKQDQTDFREIISKIKSVNFDGFLIFGYKELGNILNQIAEQGIKCKIFSSVMFEDPDILKIAGNNANGVIYTFPSFNLNSSNQHLNYFIDNYKMKYNMMPNIYSALAYDAASIILQGIDSVGNNSENLKKYLYNIKGYEGVTGTTTFDKNGDVIKDLGIKTVRNGKFVWVLNRYQ